MVSEMAPALSAAIAAVCALFAIHFATRPARDGNSSVWLAVFFGLFATQMALLSWQLSDDSAPDLGLRPVIVVLLGPSLFFFFRGTTKPAKGLAWRDGLHLILPVYVALDSLGGLLMPVGIDLAILASELLYAAIFITTTVQGPSRFAALQRHAAGAHRWLTAVALLFAALFLADLGIYRHLETGGTLGGSYVVVIALIILAGFVSYAALGAMGRPSLFDWLYETALPVTQPYARAAMEATERAELARRVQTALAEPRNYGDEDMTLLRLSRRLGVPARQVSQAINAEAGVSFSDALNAARIEAAMQRLSDPAEGDTPLLEIMMECGYRSKSNFYKQFTARAGQTPRAFRDAVTQKPD